MAVPTKSPALMGSRPATGVESAVLPSSRPELSAVGDTTVRRAGTAESTGLQLRRSGDRVVIAVTGDLDVCSAPPLRRLLSEVIEQAGEVVEVDMSGVRFVDAAGVGVLAGAHRRLRRSGARLALTGVSGSARRVLDITGLTVPPSRDRNDHSCH